jgi:plasmid maintenance system antidote protein VapI
MTASEFSEQFKVTKRYAEMILSGKRTAGKKLAIRLEAKTGIPRLCWLYPETYTNPYIPYVEKDGK